MENKILVIGIAGGTGSGKTTLMKNLISTFSGSVTLLSHDNYYRRHDELTYEERCKLNYDEPAALETDLMARHLDSLRHGEALIVRFMILRSTIGPMRPSGSPRKRSSL